MVQLAINILWLLLGIIVICAVVYLFLYVVKLFIGIPDLVEKAIWLVILILILIAALGLLVGGHTGLPGFRFGFLGPAIAANPAGSAPDLQILLGRMLT